MNGWFLCPDDDAWKHPELPGIELWESGAYTGIGWLDEPYAEDVTICAGLKRTMEMIDSVVAAAKVSA